MLISRLDSNGWLTCVLILTLTQALLWGDSSSVASNVTASEQADDGKLAAIYHDLTHARADQDVDPMVMVKGGAFPYQKAAKDNWVAVKGFLIGKYEVSVQNYCLFLNAADANGAHWDSRQEISRHGRAGSYRYTVNRGREKFPIRHVSYYDARAYADWKASQTNLNYRLPTEQEWEKAAGWDPVEEKCYAYGFHSNTIDRSKCNYNNSDGGPTEAGSYEGHTSYYGCYDMSGNLYEWTSSVYPGDTRFVRGGQWYNSYAGYCQVTHRRLYVATGRYGSIGFRLALDSASPVRSRGCLPAKKPVVAHSRPMPPGVSEAMAGAVRWLEEESHRIIRASKRTMDDGTAAFPPQVGLGYDGFWIRDYEYTLEGAIDAYSDEELTAACRVFVGGIRADGAGVDKVNFDGTPIYQPGNGEMGKHPVADGSQFTVSVAWHTYRRTQDKQLLGEIIEPLIKTMNAAPRNCETGLVHIEPGDAWNRCPYGFTDTIRKQGDLLFCSLLYVQASRQLADLLDELGRGDDASHWRQEGARVAASIRKVLWDAEVGLFRAASVVCRDHDIWGSAFAVYLGVAEASQSRAVAAYFKRHYGAIVQHGQIRHLPGGVYWEKTSGGKGRPVPRDIYQNGAYWAVATGWFVYTLDLVDPRLADQTVLDMVADFAKGGACEWIIEPTHHHLQNYLASPSLPLAGIRAMLERRAACDTPTK